MQSDPEAASVAPRRPADQHGVLVVAVDRHEVAALRAAEVVCGGPAERAVRVLEEVALVGVVRGRVPDLQVGDENQAVEKRQESRARVKPFSLKLSCVELASIL